MPNFDFPQWMLKDSSFADSLLKGAQVGAIVANNRHRNQALAAQVADNERNFILREKALESDQEQKNIMLKSKMLEMDMQKQIFADQVADKEALSPWLSEYNKLSLEERLNMPIPNVRLPATFNAINQIKDNDRMAYQQSLRGKVETAIALRLGKIDGDYAEQYLYEPDPERRREILRAGEAAAAAKAESLRAIAPTIAAESRAEVAEINASSREALATIKATATVAKSEGVSESQFVNRHLNTVLSQLENDNAYIDKSVADRTDAAAKLLQKAYRDAGMGTPAPATSTRIRVRSADGRVGTISSDKLDAALKEGYQRVD